VNIIRFVLVLLIPIILTSCNTVPKTIEISSKPVEKIKLNIPEPRPLSLSNPTWLVVTDATKDDIIDKNAVIFGITVEDYKNMAVNQAEVLRILEAYKNTLRAYKNYYEPKDEKSKN